MNTHDVQAALLSLGNPRRKFDADGNFGGETRSAMQAFRRSAAYLSLTGSMRRRSPLFRSRVMRSEVGAAQTWPVFTVSRRLTGSLSARKSQPAIPLPPDDQRKMARFGGLSKNFTAQFLLATPENHQADPGLFIG